MSLLADMRTRLTDAGITTPIALGRTPDQPDALIAILESVAERSRDFTADGLPVLERRGLQLRARAGKDAGIAAAEAIAWAAYRALSGRHAEVATGSDYQPYDWIIARHAPAHIGFDDNDRPIVVCNFSVQRWGDVT
jgi:hypothetical protein